MARPISMMSAALVTAAASGLLPPLASRLSSSQPANLTMTSTASASGAPPSAPSLPGATVPLSTGGQVIGGLLKKVGSNVYLVAPVQSLRLEWKDGFASRPLIFMNDNASPRKMALDITVQDRLGRQQKVLFGVTLQDQLGKNWAAAVEHPVFKLGPFSSQVVRVKLQFPKPSGDFVVPSALPATGFLTIRFPETKDEPVNQEIMIPEAPAPGLAGAVFAGSLAAAGLIVWITTRALKRKGVDLRGPMGNPTWIQQSWGSNITIASGLLGAIAKASLFPEHPSLMGSTSYNLLLGLFTAIVGLSPLAYGLIRRDGQATAGATGPQGYILTFLIAGGIVLWGALGQALTLALMIAEFILANTIDVLMGWVLEGLAGVLSAVLVAYGLRSLYQTAKSAADSAAAAGVVPPLPVPVARPAVVLAASEALPAHLAPWALL